MTYRFARFRSFVCSSRGSTVAGFRPLRVIIAVSTLALVLAGCGAAPFNVSLLPFLPLESRQGVYPADLAPIDLAPLATELPNFSLHRIPLNTVQIPFELNAPVSPEGLQTARVELTLLGGVAPTSSSLSVLAETVVTLYLAPGTAQDRFSPLFAIPLGSVELGSTAQADLTGELSSSQIEYLKVGSLHVGLEFSGTEVSVTNNSAVAVLFEGFTWELTSLRIRGSAAFSW